MSQRMRVAIDARYLSHGLMGGVRTYLRNLVEGLARVDTARDYVLWADRKAPLRFTTCRLTWRCAPCPGPTG